MNQNTVIPTAQAERGFLGPLFFAFRLQHIADRSEYLRFALGLTQQGQKFRRQRTAAKGKQLGDQRIGLMLFKQFNEAGGAASQIGFIRDIVRRHHTAVVKAIGR